MSSASKQGALTVGGRPGSYKFDSASRTAAHSQGSVTQPNGTRRSPSAHSRIIRDSAGNVLLHRKNPSQPSSFARVLGNRPTREAEDVYFDGDPLAPQPGEVRECSPAPGPSPVLRKFAEASAGRSHTGTVDRYAVDTPPPVFAGPHTVTSTLRDHLGEESVRSDPVDTSHLGMGSYKYGSGGRHNVDNHLKHSKDSRKPVQSTHPPSHDEESNNGVASSEVDASERPRWVNPSVSRGMQTMTPPVSGRYQRSGARNDSHAASTTSLPSRNAPSSHHHHHPVDSNDFPATRTSSPPHNDTSKVSSSIPAAYEERQSQHDYSDQRSKASKNSHTNSRHGPHGSHRTPKQSTKYDGEESNASVSTRDTYTSRNSSEVPTDAEMWTLLSQDASPDLISFLQKALPFVTSPAGQKLFSAHKERRDRDRRKRDHDDRKVPKHRDEIEEKEDPQPSSNHSAPATQRTTQTTERSQRSQRAPMDDMKKKYEELSSFRSEKSARTPHQRSYDKEAAEQSERDASNVQTQRSSHAVPRSQISRYTEDEESPIVAAHQTTPHRELSKMESERDEYEQCDPVVLDDLLGISESGRRRLQEKKSKRESEQRSESVVESEVSGSASDDGDVVELQTADVPQSSSRHASARQFTPHSERSQHQHNYQEDEDVEHDQENVEHESHVAEEEAAQLSGHDEDVHEYDNNDGEGDVAASATGASTERESHNPNHNHNHHDAAAMWAAESVPSTSRSATNASLPQIPDSVSASRLTTARSNPFSASYAPTPRQMLQQQQLESIFRRLEEQQRALVLEQQVQFSEALRESQLHQELIAKKLEDLKEQIERDRLRWEHDNGPAGNADRTHQHIPEVIEEATEEQSALIEHHEHVEHAEDVGIVVDGDRLVRLLEMKDKWDVDDDGDYADILSRLQSPPAANHPAATSVTRPPVANPHLQPSSFRPVVLASRDHPPSYPPSSAATSVESPLNRNEMSRNLSSYYAHKNRSNYSLYEKPEPTPPKRRQSQDTLRIQAAPKAISDSPPSPPPPPPQQPQQQQEQTPKKSSKKQETPKKSVEQDQSPASPSPVQAAQWSLYDLVGPERVGGPPASKLSIIHNDSTSIPVHSVVQQHPTGNFEVERQQSHSPSKSRDSASETAASFYGLREAYMKTRQRYGSGPRND